MAVKHLVIQVLTSFSFEFSTCKGTDYSKLIAIDRHNFRFNYLQIQLQRLHVIKLYQVQVLSNHPALLIMEFLYTPK